MNYKTKRTSSISVRVQTAKRGDYNEVDTYDCVRIEETVM